MAREQEYAVYMHETEVLVAFGPPEVCARTMGISLQSFYRLGERKRYRVIRLPPLPREALVHRPRPPRRDCFAFRGGECQALRETYCRWETCGFYKQRADEPKRNAALGFVPVEIKMEVGKQMDKKLFCTAQCGLSVRCADHVSNARTQVRAMDDLGGRCFFHRPAGEGDRVRFLEIPEEEPGQAAETGYGPEDDPGPLGEQGVAGERPAGRDTPVDSDTPKPASKGRGRGKKAAEVVAGQANEDGGTQAGPDAGGAADDSTAAGDDAGTDADAADAADDAGIDADTADAAEDGETDGGGAAPCQCQTDGQ